MSITVVNPQRERNAAWARRWRAENPEETARRRMWSRYHITLEQYAEKLAAQDGVCAICKRPPDSRALHIDHDHSCCPEKGRSCGKCIRDLLCYYCNSTVGKVENGTFDPYYAYVQRWVR